MTQQPRRRPASTSIPKPTWTPRLYEPSGDGPAEPDDRLTLSRHYETFFAPSYKPSAGTAKEDRTVLRVWADYVPDPDRWPDVSQDPDVREISTDLLEDFFAWCPSRGIAHNTVCKYRAHLQRIIFSLGPGNRRNKRGAGLLAEPPYIEPPKRQLKPVAKAMPMREFSQILTAGQAEPICNLPGLDCTIYQRSLHWFIWNTGLRIDTAMRLTRAMVISVDRQKWLDIPADLMKGKRHGHMVYLNACAQAALEMLPGDTDRLFPFSGWKNTQARLEKHQTHYWASAGVVHKGWGYHSLRVAMLSYLQSQNAAVAALVAPHHGNVTLDFYTMREITVPYLEALPQPDCPHLPRPKTREDLDESQRRLF